MEVADWKDTNKVLPSRSKTDPEGFTETVLLFQNGGVTLGCYIFDETCEFTDSDGISHKQRGYWHSDAEDYGHEPTHWMKLPEFPVDKN